MQKNKNLSKGGAYNISGWSKKEVLTLSKIPNQKVLATFSFSVQKSPDDALFEILKESGWSSDIVSEGKFGITILYSNNSKN